MYVALNLGHNIHTGGSKLLGMMISPTLGDRLTIIDGANGHSSTDAFGRLNSKGRWQSTDLTIDKISTLWDLDKRIVTDMATDPNTPVVLIERLATHAVAAVRGAVCENESTPIDTLWSLAKDVDPDVRYQLAENYNLPLALISTLTNDENPYVACRAQKTYDRLRAV